MLSVTQATSRDSSGSSSQARWYGRATSTRSSSRDAVVESTGDLAEPCCLGTLLFSFLLILSVLNSQGSGLDAPDADLENDEDLVSASKTRGLLRDSACPKHCPLR